MQYGGGTTQGRRKRLERPLEPLLVLHFLYCSCTFNSISSLRLKLCLSLLYVHQVLNMNGCTHVTMFFLYSYKDYLLEHRVGRVEGTRIDPQVVTPTKHVDICKTVLARLARNICRTKKLCLTFLRTRKLPTY